MDALVGIDDDDEEDTFVGGVDADDTVDVDDKFNPLINAGEFCCCWCVVVVDDKFLY